MTELHHNPIATRCFSCVVCLLLFAGCQTEVVEHPRAIEALSKHLQKDEDVTGEEVVVRVDGRAISSKEFELFWSEHDELSREEALDALIERELVLSAWATGGLEIQLEGQRRENIEGALQDARKRGMIKSLLRREVEDAGELPAPDDATVQRFVGDFFKREASPSGFSITQLVIIPPKDAVPEDWEKAGEIIRGFDARFDPKRDALVQMEEMREEAVDEFGKQGDYWIKINRGLTFKSSKADPLLDKPEGWLDVFPEVVSEVERAAKAAGENAVGARTPPIRTSVGWHIIYIDEVIKGQQPSPEETQEAVSRAHKRTVLSERYTAFAVPLLEEASFKAMPENLEEEAVQARKPSAKAKK